MTGGADSGQTHGITFPSKAENKEEFTVKFMVGVRLTAGSQI